MVRRLLHNCGYSVFHLHRIQYGSISLNEDFIKEGEVGSIDSDELEVLVNKYKMNNKIKK